MVNWKKCGLISMYIYFVIYIIAYIFLGGYLIYASIGAYKYDQLYLWTSYFMQPVGVLHPLAISVLNLNLQVIFSIYLVAGIIFWIFVRYLFFKKVDKFITLLLNLFLHIAPIILFSFQMFFTVEFGKCIKDVNSIRYQCEKDDIYICSDATNNARAGYFFTLVTGATIIPVMKNFDLIEKYNVTCDGNINIIRNYSYFSTAIGSILIISIVMFILTYMFIEIFNSLSPCIRDVKKSINDSWQNVVKNKFSNNAVNNTINNTINNTSIV